jgi:hypothetical protein
MLLLHIKIVDGIFKTAAAAKIKMKYRVKGS